MSPNYRVTPVGAGVGLSWRSAGLEGTTPQVRPTSPTRPFGRISRTWRSLSPGLLHIFSSLRLRVQSPRDRSGAARSFGPASAAADKSTTRRTNPASGCQASRPQSLTAAKRLELAAVRSAVAETSSAQDPAPRCEITREMRLVLIYRHFRKFGIENEHNSRQPRAP